jgi:hypothetical protein
MSFDTNKGLEDKLNEATRKLGEADQDLKNKRAEL